MPGAPLHFNWGSFFPHSLFLRPWGVVLKRKNRKTLSLRHIRMAEISAETLSAFRRSFCCLQKEGVSAGRGYFGRNSLFWQCLGCRKKFFGCRKNLFWQKSPFRFFLYFCRNYPFLKPLSFGNRHEEKNSRSFDPSEEGQPINNNLPSFLPSLRAGLGIHSPVHNFCISWCTLQCLSVECCFLSVVFSALRKNVAEAETEVMQNMGIAMYDSKSATRLPSPPSCNSNLSDPLWVIRLGRP